MNQILIYSVIYTILLEKVTHSLPKKHVYISSLNIVSELFAHFLLVKLFPWISHTISIIDWQTLLGLIITQLAVVYTVQKCAKNSLIFFIACIDFESVGRK